MSQQTISKIILGMAVFFLVATVALKMSAPSPSITNSQDQSTIIEEVAPQPSDSTHDVGPITDSDSPKSFAQEVLNLAINDPITGELVVLKKGEGQTAATEEYAKVSTITLKNLMFEQMVGLRNDIVAVAEVRSGEDPVQSYLLMFSKVDGIWFHMSSIQVGENVRVVALAADKLSAEKRNSGDYVVSLWTQQFTPSANARNSLFTVNVKNGIFDYQSVKYK